MELPPLRLDAAAGTVLMQLLLCAEMELPPLRLDAAVSTVLMQLLLCA